MLRRWSAVVFACLVLLALLVIAYRTGNGIRDRVSRDPATTRDLPFSSDAVPALQPPASDGGVGVVSDLGPREVTIAGSVEVGAVGSRPRTCFVRAVDAETLKAIAEVAANADGRFEASFPTAATGSSVVVLVANGSEGAHH